MRRIRRGLEVSFGIDKMIMSFSQHIENFGFYRVNSWMFFSFQWRVLQWGQLTVRKETWKESYTIFMGPKEWAIFIKGSRGWHASKCLWAGNRLIGSRGAAEGAATAIIGLLRRLCGDSVRTLLAFRSWARRRVREVVGRCIGDEGGVVQAIEVVSLLRRNLCNVDWLYQLEVRMIIRNLTIRL